MLTDLQIIDVCAALYEEQPKGFWDIIWPVDGSYCASKMVDGYNVIVFRGSTTVLDWFEDLGSEFPVWDKELGHCAAGFLEGMHNVEVSIDRKWHGPTIITGHSLGAAHAALYAAHRCAIDYPPVALINFGEPRPGFERFRDLLKEISFVRSYRNLNDPVTEVPCLGIPGTEIDLYVHSTALTPLSASAPSDDPWGPLAEHHIELYRRGIASLGL
jgi:hypothetical protein